MSLVEMIVIAVALGMDAFAISITDGSIIHRLEVQGGHHSRRRELQKGFLLAFCFAFFHALMPILGWVLGETASAWIQPIGHWIAAFIFLFIGGNMLWAVFTSADEDENEEVLKNPMHLWTLLGVCLATSIDAFGVGVSLAALEVNIVMPIIVIGLISGIMAFIGTCIGDAVGQFMGKKLELFGGLLLIIIGGHILIEYFSGMATGS